MINYGRLVYNEEKEEGEVLLDPDFFHEVHQVIQLDTLKDWIYYLTELYEDIRIDCYEERQCLLLEND